MDFLINFLMGVAWFFILLVPVILLHELGHLLAARLTKTRVPEFGIGIPPRLWGKRWKGILWSLNALPIGGFVRIFGDGDVSDEMEDELRKLETKYKKLLEEKTDSKQKNRNLKQLKTDLEEQRKAELQVLKTRYAEERMRELVAGREADYFLEQKGITLNQEWQEQLQSGKLDSTKRQVFETLVAWEFDNLLENKSAFFNKPYWAKVLIMLGGITSNFIVAWVIFFALLLTSGIPALIMPDVPVRFYGVEVSFMSDFSRERIERRYPGEGLAISFVQTESVAEEIGLQPQDQILRFEGEKPEEPEVFIDQLEQNGGQEVSMQVQKTDGEIQDLQFELPEKKEGEAQLGVGFLYNIGASSWLDAALMSFDILWTSSVSVLVLVGAVLGALFGFGQRELIDTVGGPVAVSGQGSNILDRAGVGGIMAVIGLISLNSAIINLIPIPALDGGRILLVTLQRLLGKRNRRLEYLIISISMIALIILSILIAVKDVRFLLDN